MGDIDDFSIEYIAEPISEEKIHETLHQIIRTYLKEKRQRHIDFNESTSVRNGFFRFLYLDYLWRFRQQFI